MWKMNINTNHVSAQLLAIVKNSLHNSLQKQTKLHGLQENDSDSDVYLNSVDTDHNVKNSKVNMKYAEKQSP